MKYGLNTSQTYIGYFVALTRDNWLFYLMAFKKRHRKLLKEEIEKSNEIERMSILTKETRMKQV